MACCRFQILLVVLTLLRPGPCLGAELPPESLLVSEEGRGIQLPGGWEYVDTNREPGRFTFRFREPGGATFAVAITPRTGSERVIARSVSFDIAHVDRMEGTDSPEGLLFTTVVEAIQRNDAGQMELTASAVGADVPSSGPDRGEDVPGAGAGLWDRLSGMSPLDRTQVCVALVLLVGGLLAMALSFRLQWWAWTGAGPLAGGAVVAAVVVAAVVRFSVAPRLVKIYWAYDFVHEVVSFEGVPRYGAGAFSLYRLLFCFVPPHHFAIVGLHTVLGLLTLLAAVAFMRRHRPEGPAAPVFAALLALTPMFVRDHRTESMAVVTVFYLWQGLLLLDGFLDGRRRWCLAGAVPFLGLAVLSRPEMVIIVPAAVAVAVLARGRRGVCDALQPLFLAGGVLGALLGVQVLHLISVVPGQVAADALPALDADLLRSLPRGLLVRNAWLQIDYFPVGVTAAAALGVLGAPRGVRSLAWGFAGLALLWTAVTFVDLPITSEPRLHVPAAMLVTFLGALGVEAVCRLLERLPRRARGPVGLGLCVLVVLSAVPSIPSLFAPTNEDQEERLFSRAVASLPEERVCLVHISSRDDPPEGKTHRFHPDYLLHPPHRRDRVEAITDWETPGITRDCPGGAYFYLGLLCYAAVWEEADTGTVIERIVEGRCLFDQRCWRVSFLNLDLEKPRRQPLLSSCARMLEKVSGDPVFEEDLENLGDNEFGYYPEVPSFRVGLYRLADPVR
ncbi:MAG: glycosyltransferase family 39 protein [Pseudomonadota bacterium]